MIWGTQPCYSGVTYGGAGRGHYGARPVHDSPMSLLKRHRGELTELLKRSHTPGGCKQAACLRCRCVTRARFLRGERAGGPASGYWRPPRALTVQRPLCQCAEPFSSSCDHALIAGRLTVPTSHPFSHRKTSQGHTSVCLQGGQPLVSALLGSCKDGDRSCPLSHTCGVLLGHSPRGHSASPPSQSFHCCLPAALTHREGPLPARPCPKDAKSEADPQACSPRALRHRPRLSKTQSTASKKAFSVSPTRHYILTSCFYSAYFSIPAPVHAIPV